MRLLPQAPVHLFRSSSKLLNSDRSSIDFSLCSVAQHRLKSMALGLSLCHLTPCVTLTNRSLIAAMIEEPRELRTKESLPPETDVSLPFPFQHTFCRYEPIEKRIEKALVLVVDCLLR